MNKSVEIPARLVLGGEGSGRVPNEENGHGGGESQRPRSPERKPPPALPRVATSSAGRRPGRASLIACLVVMAAIVGPTSAEGLKTMADPMGWKFSYFAPPMAKSKLTKNLCFGSLMALVLVGAVSVASEKMLRRFMKMPEHFDGDAKQASRWGMMWVTLAPYLIGIDFILMYIGLCKQRWGNVGFYPMSLLGAAMFTGLFFFFALIRIGLEKQWEVRSSNVMRALLVAATLATGMTGCDGPVEDTALIEEREPVERVLMMILDTSPSFEKRNARNGEAFEFSLQVCDEMFKNSAGSNDLIVVSQISGTTRTLLFEGTPMQLRSQFPTPDAWHKHVMAMAVPGSMVNEAVRQATTHLLDMPGMRQGQVKSALIVISDMMESSANGQQAEGAMMTALREYGAAGGHVYVYYCDQGVLELWKNRLQQTGHSRNDVFVGERTMPPVPVFK